MYHSDTGWQNTVVVKHTWVSAAAQNISDKSRKQFEPWSCQHDSAHTDTPPYLQQVQQVRLYWKTVLIDLFYLIIDVFCLTGLDVVIEPEQVILSLWPECSAESSSWSQTRTLTLVKLPAQSQRAAPTGNFYECRETRAAEPVREELTGETLRQIHSGSLGAAQHKQVLSCSDPEDPTER